MRAAASRFNCLDTRQNDEEPEEPDCWSAGIPGAGRNCCGRGSGSRPSLSWPPELRGYRVDDRGGGARSPHDPSRTGTVLRRAGAEQECPLDPDAVFCHCGGHVDPVGGCGL